MSIVRGTPPAPQPDFTYEQAVEETRRDYARLLYEHDLFWRVEGGKPIIGCCCSEIEFEPTVQQKEHILGAIRKARGPLKRK